MAATLMAQFQKTDQMIGLAMGLQLGCNPQFVRSNAVERRLGLAVDLFVAMDFPQMAWAASGTAFAALEVALQVRQQMAWQAAWLACQVVRKLLAAWAGHADHVGWVIVGPMAVPSLRNQRDTEGRHQAYQGHGHHGQDTSSSRQLMASAPFSYTGGS